jgi:hypothetical protein
MMDRFQALLSSFAFKLNLWRYIVVLVLIVLSTIMFLVETIPWYYESETSRASGVRASRHRSQCSQCFGTAPSPRGSPLRGLTPHPRAV